MEESRDQNLQALERRVAARGLSKLASLKPFKPSVRLTTRRIEDAHLPVGATRLGGYPDVPPGFDWPTRKVPEGTDDAAGVPLSSDMPLALSFIAQLDLSSLPRIDDRLPERGWLLFFYDQWTMAWGYDPADRGHCRVVYFDAEPSSLQRVKASDRLPEYKSSPSCEIKSSIEWTLTAPNDVCSREQFEALEEIEQEHYGKQPKHRFLGNPQVVQNPMELECQLVTNGLYCGDSSGYQDPRGIALAAGAADWELLLQVDTDEDGPGWMWGDCGTIYFWIRRQDLSARRFDQAWLILQCG